MANETAEERAVTLAIGDTWSSSAPVGRDEKRATAEHARAGRLLWMLFGALHDELAELRRWTTRRRA